MLVGKQVYDLPPSGPLQPLRRWEWNYNLNLIGKDAFPVGKSIYDLPPRAYPPPGGTWTYAYNVYFAPTPPLPTGLQVYDLPPRAYPPPGGTWTWQYNANLIGQDRLPTGVQVYDLPPRSYPPSGPTWTTWYNLSATQVPIGKIIYDLPPKAYPPSGPTWAWSYNLNLVGQDQLPIGAKVYDLPPTGYIYPNDLRTWINRVNLALTVQAAVLPFNQYDWPNPKIPGQPAQSWTANYNINLIGKDRLPVGKQFTDLPAQPIYPNDLRTWITRTNHALTLTFPFRQSDWPNPRDYEPVAANRTWTSYLTLYLYAQTVMPVGKVIYDLPPIAQPYYNSARTWDFSLSRALIVPPAVLPFNQYDWPIPPAWALQTLQKYYDRGFATYTNPNLFPQPGPPIPPVPPPTPPEPSTRTAIPGLEWQFYDRAREPGPIGWR